MTMLKVAPPKGVKF